MKLNVHDAKTHLSKHLEAVEQGDSFLLCRRNVPVAELRPIPQPRTEPRVIGIDAGKFTIPPEFFEPLPDDVLDGFEGK